MKLTRLRLEHFRQFDQPLEIDGLEPGLNLFCGPNESGKSTVAAALRAAFFERYRASSAEDLRPWHDASAAPSVWVDFDTGGHRYRLFKRFLGKKRCELEIDGQRYEGTDAEDKLAQLLGFRYPGRGPSTPSLQGIPGLLWIDQGQGQHLREPLAHAADYLRAALEQSVGQIASTSGDDLLARIDQARQVLLTPATGAPRGPYAQAIAACQAHEAALQALEVQREHYRQQVDTLSELRREHAVQAERQPWQAMLTQRQAAETALRQAGEQAHALQQARSEAARLDARLHLLQAQHDALHREHADAQVRAQAWQEAEQNHQQAVQAQTQTRRRLAEAESAAAQASLSRERLQADQQRHQRHQQYLAARERRDELTGLVQRARQAQAEVDTLQQQAAASHLAQAVCDQLAQQTQGIQELSVRQETAAPRLRYRLAPHARLSLRGQTEETLAGEGERALPARVTLELPGLGELDIEPGGQELAQWREAQQALQAAHRALLETHGLQDTAQALARRQQHLQWLAQAGSARSVLDALAPQGLAALESAWQLAAQTLAALGDEQTAAPPPAPATEHLTAAELTERHTRDAAAQAQRDAHQALERASAAQAAFLAAEAEHARAQAQLNAPGRAERLQQLRVARQEEQAQLAGLAARIAPLEQQLAQARPDLLEQDIERLTRSIEQSQTAQVQRQTQIARLEAELQALGTQGLDSRRADLAGALAHAQRRREELARRARALTLLQTLLREQRQQLTRRLQAPLQARLDHYLPILFEQGRLDLDDALGPVRIERRDAHAGASGPVRDLSFGAREQLGVMARLAYADLLKAAGHPTLLVLDDVLLHSDAGRLDRMKRVLFDAARRHQILLFTCRPEQWQDLGVAPRPIGRTLV